MVGTILGRIAAEVVPAVLSQRGKKRHARISWMVWDLVLRARRMTDLPGTSRAAWVVGELYELPTRGGWWRRRRWKWIRREEISAVTELVRRVYQEQQKLGALDMADLPPAPPGCENCP